MNDVILDNIKLAIKHAQQKPPAVMGQGYFGAAYFLGVQLRDYGVTEESASKIAVEVWNNRCRPPMTHEHLTRIIHECFQFKPDRKS